MITAPEYRDYKRSRVPLPLVGAPSGNLYVVPRRIRRFSPYRARIHTTENRRETFVPGVVPLRRWSALARIAHSTRCGHIRDLPHFCPSGRPPAGLLSDDFDCTDVIISRWETHVNKKVYSSRRTNILGTVCIDPVVRVGEPALRRFLFTTISQRSIMFSMRIHDTRALIDLHSAEIARRFHDWETNLDTLLFLRLYRLPPYFDVPLAMKARVSPYITSDLEARLFHGRPKETLFAAELGCCVCGARPDLNGSLWLAELDDGWRDGVCPHCKPPPTCALCGAPPKAPWNLCADCWIDFHRQDLRSLAIKYGTCSTLLLATPEEVVKKFPTTNKAQMTSGQLTEFVPRPVKKKRIREVADLDINVKEAFDRYVK